MMRKLFFLLVFVFSAIQVSGQAAKATRSSAQTTTNQVIAHVDQFLAAQRSNGNPRIESLIKDLQPSSYAENGSVKTYGDNPIFLFTDVRSMANLNGLEFPKNDIEIITVKIKNRSELSSALDFSALSAFPKLRYVYLLSETTATATEIAQMVRNNDPRLGVFYNVALTK